MDGLAYVGEIDGRHKFHFLADDNRPVLEVYVDLANSKPGVEEMPIYINGVNHPTERMQITKGVTRLVPIASEDLDGIPQGVTIVPDPELIVKYIVPRTATMMARVYVPKSGN
jgi:hypothetical protein